ncbi:jg23546 [Pararge aegeria aegeria]|uniref:Jg23546 protein n=1 Tax=Pararge aegeria aegeria TaxID=348720 RepID=A0A8S4S0C8_9NEOP|nr:jg23546 [Pararge aegeria aegeria]
MATPHWHRYSPPTTWRDDIKRDAGSRWKRVAQDHGLSNSLQKTNVQQWTSTAQMIIMMMMASSQVESDIDHNSDLTADWGSDPAF